MKYLGIIKLFVFVLLFLQSYSLAQTPDSSWQIYDDSQLARIDVTIPQSSLNWIYQNVNSDSDHVASVRFRNKWLDVTMDSVGFRLRGETSRQSKKKSFKISFNAFIKGRKLCGVKDLNVNGEHNDPSIIRSKLCFDLFAKSGLKTSRAAHTEVYINGIYYGLYISVENIDDTFLKRSYADATGNLWKCLYPADLAYLGESQSAYSTLSNGSHLVYELKTNETLNDFSQFVRLIRILNNTSGSALADSLEGILDVADVLHYFAMNVMLGGWDSYWSLCNNYYLYHQPATGRFTIIPYDYDNTFGIDWFNVNWYSINPYNVPKILSGAKPLAEKLIANAQFKNLYTHMLSHINTKIYPLSLWEGHIDSLRSRISYAASRDTFRVLDYGFSMNDFVNSYSASQYTYAHVKNGLKQFVNLRCNSLPAQLQYSSAPPILYKLDYFPKYPRPEDSIHVIVSAYDNNGLSEVSIQFKTAGSGITQTIPMKAQPVAGSLKIEELDRFVGVIPPLGNNVSAQFSVYLKDSTAQNQTYPRKGPVSIKATASAQTSIVVNEFLADNTQYPDPAGEFDDYVELFNPLTVPVKLTGMYMTDSPTQLKKWKITAESLYIAPKSYLVVWADEQLSQPGIHAAFKLSKSGEYIALTDTNGTSILDSITFGQQTTNISLGRTPDGGSLWKSMTPTPGAANPITSINSEVFAPRFVLADNFPNPFNPETVIQYEIGASESSNTRNTLVNLRIFDLLGREVYSLVKEELQAGKYSVTWNAAGFPSGVYFLRLDAGRFSAVKKMVLLR